jgi:hypothetical protein
MSYGKSGASVAKDGATLNKKIQNSCLLISLKLDGITHDHQEGFYF